MNISYPMKLPMITYCTQNIVDKIHDGILPINTDRSGPDTRRIFSDT